MDRVPFPAPLIKDASVFPAKIFIFQPRSEFCAYVAAGSELWGWGVTDRLFGFRYGRIARPLGCVGEDFRLEMAFVKPWNYCARSVERALGLVESLPTESRSVYSTEPQCSWLRVCTTCTFRKFA